jgi:hypothetical protein
MAVAGRRSRRRAIGRGGASRQGNCACTEQKEQYQNGLCHRFHGGLPRTSRLEVLSYHTLAADSSPLL